MRYLLLLSLLLFLISPVQAEHPGQASETLHQNNPSLNIWGIISLSSADIDTAFLRTDRDAQPTCFTMRSYYVERESKHSDATHPIGSSTCMPSSKFDLKPVPIAEQGAQR